MERYRLREKIMRLTRMLLMVTVMVACTTQSLPAWAQLAELFNAFKQYQTLNKQGEYAKAIPFAQTFIALAKEEYGVAHQFYTNGLNNLARLYDKQSRYTDAEPLYKRALAIKEKALGRDHLNTATILNNLARLYNKQSRYTDAEPLYKRALAIREKALGPDHPKTAISLNNLAEHYRIQGRYTDAEPLYKRALEIREKALGPDHYATAISLNNLAEHYRIQGRYAEAEPLYKRSLVIKEKALGPDHSSTAISLSNLGLLYKAQGRYADAESLYKRSLAIKEKALGQDHPETAISLNNLARLYQRMGHYADAEPLFKRVLAIREKALGPDHPKYATGFNNLAALYKAQGRYAEAEPLYKRSLVIKEKALGPDHPSLAITNDNLGGLYSVQGRYAEAELLHKRSLEIFEKTRGPDHPSTAISLTNLAETYRARGRYADAEPLYKRVIAIFKKALRPNHPNFASSLSNLALLYKAQGRFAEAVPLVKRALAIEEEDLGPDHPSTATGLSNLAGIYRAQGRYADAVPLHVRALAIREKALGPDHSSTAISLTNLAELNKTQGRYADAEPLFKRALAIWEKTLGPDHPGVTTPLSYLADLYRKQGRYANAGPLYVRALAITEKAFGPDHPNTAANLAGLALLYKAQYRFADAEPLFKRALAITEKTLGPDHPDVATALNNLAWIYRDTGDQVSSLSYSRRAVSIRRSRATRSGGNDAGRTSEQKSKRSVFLFHTEAALAAGIPGERRSLIAEAYESAQLASATQAGTAIARMAARFAAGDDGLAKLVRERQDAADQWQILDKALVSAASQPPGKRDKAKEQTLRDSLTDLGKRIAAIDAGLTTTFPQYAVLASNQPGSLSDIQALLEPDEAMVSYLSGPQQTIVFALRHDRVEAKVIKLVGSETLEGAVGTLRRGLDLTGLNRLPSFDTKIAFRLYQIIFKPIEPLLEGARHVFVVPGGALTGLPFGVLVTEQTDVDTKDPSGYRKVPWLARKYAMSTLPSVSSLKALRAFTKRAQASRPFLGIGDPELEGETGTARGIKLVSLFTSPGIANVKAVRQLAPLPESREELQSLARSLGAGDGSLLVGSDATETNVKSAPLSDFKVIAFATHGLVAGELAGVSEPALVLTPPLKGTDTDDGLLTASEVAQLKLNADWVILSACNTAAADGTPGANGLSGLAKAFFYAGSRALLVSHWPVESDAAVALTTRMLALSGKGVIRAEAHRQAMMAMIDKGPARNAHPALWAPFVVVGEGGASR
jgi:tetratricopeptide (TPR) repeat protein